MVSPLEIQFLEFNHKEKTYKINDKIIIESDKKAVCNDEMLWLLKIDGEEIYFAKSKESHKKDYTSIVRYHMTTKKFDHFLTLEEEISNVGWIPSKQPPGLPMMIHSPQRLISLQKLSVTQELAPAHEED
jgi:hypothetical protein